jgi:membrane fusion protein
MFRTEVEAFRPDRLAGDVVIAVPLAWQAIGYLLLGGVAAAGLLLSFAQYARVEVATGTIVPEAGVVAIAPSKMGVISSLPVREGQLVAAGTELASIRADLDSRSGESFDAQIEAAITQQDSSLAARSRATGRAYLAQRAQLLALQAGLASELSELESQIAMQEELVASAGKDLETGLALAKSGYISGNEIRRRQETLSLRRQALSQLRQSLADKRAALAQAKRNAAQASAQASAEAADITAQRAQVAQQAASTAGSRSYVLRAPIAGTVTALVARVGQPTHAQDPIMTIVPANSRLTAEIAAPTSAIGFIKPGQEVRLAIDAFPYQRFGTVKGRIITVATSAISRPRADGKTEMIYPVIATLDQQALVAFGRREPLVPGMTLSARIVTEKQSLLKWLFSPLYAVKSR